MCVSAVRAEVRRGRRLHCGVGAMRVCWVMLGYAMIPGVVCWVWVCSSFAMLGSILQSLHLQDERDDMFHPIHQQCVCVELLCPAMTACWHVYVFIPELTWWDVGAAIVATAAL